MSKKTKKGLRRFGVAAALLLGLFFGILENHAFPSAGLMLTGLFVAWIAATLVIGSTADNGKHRRV